MNKYSIILIPFSFIYKLITDFRNFLFNKKLRGTVKFETNVISVGNIEVGGTGKTPMTDFLIKKLSDQNNIAVLSRGYKRKTKGFRILGEVDTAETAGDESFQLFKKYGPEVIVAVSAERETAIPFILAEEPETNIIILDDAFQYRTVIPSVSILLTRYSRPFYTDHILPAGRLRESRKNADRADIIVVSKCKPDISSAERNEIQSRISKYTNKPVFFTTLTYSEPTAITEWKKIPDQVILISGIANSGDLMKYTSDHFSLIKHYDFPDHYNYTVSDLTEIEENYGEDLKNGKIGILITEKDAAKWTSVPGLELWKTWPVFCLSVECTFIEGEDIFMNLIQNSIKEYSLEE